MGFFNNLKKSLGVLAQHGTEDKDFDRYLKSIKSLSLAEQLLGAYNHTSEKSAFWWYENCDVKPNTGSKEDMLKLHNKFRMSLRFAEQDVQERFISLVLPNVDFKQKGFDSREICVKKIMAEFNKMAINTAKNPNAFKSITPFLTDTYWDLYNKTLQQDEIGEFIKL